VISLSSARLEQNIPNPFGNTTMIEYYIPETASSALIKVTGNNGEVISNVQINNKGKGQITFSTPRLSQGLYYYTLMIDGQVVDTKKMVLNR